VVLQGLLKYKNLKFKVYIIIKIFNSSSVLTLPPCYRNPKGFTPLLRNSVSRMVYTTYGAPAKAEGEHHPHPCLRKALSEGALCPGTLSFREGGSLTRGYTSLAL